LSSLSAVGEIAGHATAVFQALDALSDFLATVRKNWPLKPNGQANPFDEFEPLINALKMAAGEDRSRLVRMEDSITELSERLGRVEQQSRRIRIAVIGLFCVAVVSLGLIFRISAG
jgi:hypothetical protein